MFLQLLILELNLFDFASHANLKLRLQLSETVDHYSNLTLFNYKVLKWSQFICNSLESSICPVVEWNSVDSYLERNHCREGIRYNRFPSLKNHHPFLEVERSFREDCL